jgi:succinoglycan biosynthesis transport protein ExoP
MELKSLHEEKDRIRKEIAGYEKKIARAPFVEKTYNELTRDYENAKLRYNEMMTKLMEARVAQGMEETQRGERFTIIDPAQYPEKPFKPNRLAIVLIGLVLALGAGVGLAAAKESLDTSIKSAEELERLAAAPVLAQISLMETAEEKRSRFFKRALVFLLFIGIIIGALILVHLFVMPLDILWIKLQRRITLGLGL